MARHAELLRSSIACRLGAGVVFAALAGCVHAQPLGQGPAFEATESSATFAGVGPSAGLTAVPSGERGWSVIGFYAIGEKARGDVQPARWWVARVARVEGERRRIRWADSRTCPALVDILLRMTRIAPASFSIRGMAPDAPQPRYIADGVVYRAWSDGGVQSDGAPIHITMTSTGGGLADWGKATLAALEPCWSDSQPPPPPRS